MFNRLFACGIELPAALRTTRSINSAPKKSFRLQRYRQHPAIEALEDRLPLTLDALPCCTSEVIEPMHGEGESARNNPPILSPVGEQWISASFNPYKLPIEASDLDGDALELRVQSESIEFHLKESLGLESGPDFRDYLGADERWLRGSNGWYYITPDGNFYQWENGDPTTDPLVERLTQSHHDDLSLLTDAALDASPVDVQIDEKRIVFLPENDYLGRFVVTVTVEDGNGGIDSETFLVNSVSNAPPSVNAGEDQQLSEGTSAILVGKVHDDSVPSHPGGMETRWTQLSGPSPVEFLDEFSTDTIAILDLPGVYTLQLEATDGEKVAVDTVLIEVKAGSTTGLPDPVAFWSFSEGTGNLTEDAGSSYNGIIQGAAWRSTTAFGSHLHFDGIDDYVDTGSWDIDGQTFTITAWINADSVSASKGEGRVVSKALGTAGDQHYWMLGTALDGDTSRLRFRLRTNGRTDTLIANDGDLTPGRWHHVAAVYDGSWMSLYLDGLEVGKMPKEGVIATDSRVPVWLGNNPSSGTRAFHGGLDEIRIYDSVINAEQIKSLAEQNQAPVVHAGENRTLIAPWTSLLDATIEDDGLPFSQESLMVRWTQISGPGNADFVNSNSVDTRVAFSQDGEYILQLEAYDGEKFGSDTVVIRVEGTEAPSEPSPLVHFPFSEGVGATTRDISSGRVGELVDAAWQADSPLGNSVSFDGVDDYVDTGKWDVSGEAITLSSWIRADSFLSSSGEGRIISKSFSNAGQDHFWMLSTIASGSDIRLRFRLKTDGYTDTLIAPSGNLATNRWYHVAAVYDGSDMRLYLDGVEVASMPKVGAISTDATVPVWIGNNPDTQTRPFHGLIDDMRVYDVALTAAQIASLFSQASGYNQPPAVDAGDNRSVIVSTALALDGSVTDDGLPNPPGGLAVQWSKLSGPGSVSFEDANAVDTVAVFDQPGTYSLQLLASDGEKASSDTLMVTVQEQQQVSGFFVSPGGSASGDGSMERPWDLATAVAQPSAVQPGDTLWLRGGTYQGAFNSQLSGTETAPITVRSYPGEEVRLDVGSQSINILGDYTHWRDFEVFSSKTATRVTDVKGPNADDADPNVQRGALRNRGSHTKLINLVVHDLSLGIGFWADGAGGEVYGSIIYNNGWLGPTNGESHGIYTQNEIGTKIYADNIIFNQFDHNFHAYGSSAAHLKGLVFEGNTTFNAGAGAGQGYPPSREVLIGGGTPVENLTVKNNYSYHGDAFRGIVSLGYYAGPDNRDMVLQDNYFATELQIWQTWDSIQSSGNTVTGRVVGPSKGITRVSDPSGTEIFVRPNQYQADRGHVVVYNWDRLASVEIDLSKVLTVGSSYEIHHVYDLFGDPIVSGVYDGSKVSLPMRDTIAPVPIGGHELSAPITLDREFGAFLVSTPSEPPANLLASTAGNLESAAPISQAQLGDIVNHAVAQWTLTGLDHTQVASLANVQFQFADLAGTKLGQATRDTVILDITAAGHGWFVDNTPELDDEFFNRDGELFAKEDSEAFERMDLLTVVMHELGHVIGQDDSEAGIMNGTLESGIRRR